LKIRAKCRFDPTTPAECQKILRETSHPLNYRGEKPTRVLDALAAVKRVKEKL